MPRNQNNMPEIEIQDTMPFHLEMCKALLVECNVPTQGLEDQFQNFIIMRLNDQLIGMIGLEQYQQVGLLRSLAIRSNYQKKGLGAILVNALMEKVMDFQIKKLYLLTQTAEAFFTKQGFETIDHTNAPSVIQSTKEFTNANLKNVVLMQKILD